MFEKYLCRIFKKKKITVLDIVASVFTTVFMVPMSVLVTLLVGSNVVQTLYNHSIINQVAFDYICSFAIGALICLFLVGAITIFILLLITTYVILPILNVQIAECPLNKK